MEAKEKLKAWRVSRGLTAAAAARKRGVSVRTWENWEQGRRHGSAKLRGVLRSLRALPAAAGNIEDLIAFREARQLTATAAARRCGVPVKTWLRWEARRAGGGKVPVTARLVSALRAAKKKDVDKTTPAHKNPA